MTYGERDVVTFEEGLIGLPEMRRMVLAEQTDIRPFLWMVSADDPQFAFLVVSAAELLEGFEPTLSEDERARLNFDSAEELTVLSVCVIEAEWERSTVNLRAPLFISSRTMRGAQVVLPDAAYRVDEPLTAARAA